MTPRGSGSPVPGPPLLLAALAAAVLVLAGCAGAKPATRPAVKQAPVYKGVRKLGYAIQAGAFSNVDNAARLTDSLRQQGIDAYYFKGEGGIYRVRFGDFPGHDEARTKAEKLKAGRVIEEFYIVQPKDHAVAKHESLGSSYLRRELVRTARTFLDVPYRWGGESAEDGFDCSGFTMAVYDLNGLSLPRSSRDQFAAGDAVDRGALQAGDLVFFATNGGKKVSHVGLYIGGGEFIHAPRTGKKIRTDSLSDEYYRKRYLGGRTYL